MGYIYCIENLINGKKYIGQTEFTLEDRWNSHLHDWKTKAHLERRPLYYAFTKYGIDNFKIFEIENCEDSLLDEKEQYYIDLYRTYVGFEDCNGYNATRGGEGASYFPYSDEEVIDKYNEVKSIKSVAKHFNCDEKTISKRLKRNGIEVQFTYHKEVLGKKVIQYDLKTKQEIQRFTNQSDAAQYLIDNGYTTQKNKYTVGYNIGRCCRKERKSAFGFYWEWV